MDNLTHTLIGTLAGEALARTAGRHQDDLPEAVRRNVFVTLAAIGSNLPDADLLYSFIGDKVNYLLHHRGHSHTIVGALLLAALALVVTLWWLKRRGLTASRRDVSWFAAILVVTPLLHIAMDATNNYGVHPFWPIDRRWYYGDSVFIAEPLLWAACAPLIPLLRTWLARTVATLVIAVGIGLLLYAGLLPPVIAIVWALITVAMLATGRWASARIALSAGIALWLGTTALFIVSSRAAARRVEALAQRDFPHARLVDHVLTAMPANPLCWDFMLIQTEDGNLALRRGMLSLAPDLLPVARCTSARLELRTTAPLQPIDASDAEAVNWHGEILTPLADLADLIEEELQRRCRDAVHTCSVARAARRRNDPGRPALRPGKGGRLCRDRSAAG